MVKLDTFKCCTIGNRKIIYNSPKPQECWAADHNGTSPSPPPQIPNQPGATLKLKKTLAVVVVDFLSSTSSSSFNIHILSLWMPGRGRMQYKRRQMNESGRQIASENQIVRVVRTVVIQPYRTSELNESCSLNNKWQAVSYVSQPMWSDHQKRYQGRANLAKGSTGDYQKQLCVCVCVS